MKVEGLQSESSSERRNEEGTPAGLAVTAQLFACPHEPNAAARQDISHSDFQSNGDWINIRVLNVNTLVVHQMCDGDPCSA